MANIKIMARIVTAIMAPGVMRMDYMIKTIK